MNTNFAPTKQVRLDHPAVVSNHAAPSDSSAPAGTFAPNASGHARRCDQWGHPCSGCVKAEISNGEHGRILADQRER